MVHHSFAHYYKKQKKYQAALEYAEKAVRMNAKLKKEDQIPLSFFLTACLYGLVSDPSRAGLQYMECLNLVTAQLRLIKPINGAETILLDPLYIIQTATMHNMAIEWANLHLPEQCREALTNAMDVSAKYLPQNHPVVLRILATYKIMSQHFLFSEDLLTLPSQTLDHNKRNTPRPIPPATKATSFSPRRELVSPVRPSTVQSSQLAGNSPRKHNFVSPVRPITPTAIRLQHVPKTPLHTQRLIMRTESRLSMIRQHAALTIQVCIPRLSFKTL